MALSKAISELRERIRLSPGKIPRGSVELAGVQLNLGGVHEWFGSAAAGMGQPDRHWLPPMCILADLARRAIAQRAVSSIFWIGRRLWPYPLLLDQHRHVLARSVLIDPPDNDTRLWAIDVALRTPVGGVAGGMGGVAVIADAQGLTLPHTRRLQLSAGAFGGLCLLARPPGELDRLSAASTRWRITPAVSSTSRPRWTLALLRHKDRPALTDEPPSWIMEWNHAQGLVCVPAPLAYPARGATAHAG